MSLCTHPCWVNLRPIQSTPSTRSGNILRLQQIGLKEIQTLDLNGNVAKTNAHIFIVDLTNRIFFLK